MGGWAGLEVGVGLNSMGEGLQLPDIKLFVRDYREEQPELGVWRLLYSVDTVNLHLGR